MSRPRSRSPVLLVLIILILFPSAATMAAPSTPSAVCFPVEAGGAIARYSQEFRAPAYDFPFRLGAHFGAGIRMRLTDLFAANLAVAFDRRGAKVDGSFPIHDGTGQEIGRGSYTATDALDYLCFPLSVDATLHRDPVAPYLKVGVEMSSLLSGKENSVLKTIDERTAESKGIKNRFTSSDLALLTGVGFTWQWKLPTYLEVRYVHGLKDITKGPADQRTRAFIGVIGVRL